MWIKLYWVIFISHLSKPLPLPPSFLPPPPSLLPSSPSLLTSPISSQRTPHVHKKRDPDPMSTQGPHVLVSTQGPHVCSVHTGTPMCVVSTQGPHVCSVHMRCHTGEDVCCSDKMCVVQIGSATACSHAHSVEQSCQEIC